MVEFSLTPRVIKMGEIISYQVNGFRNGTGYYIILIKNYNQSMDEYTLSQQENVLTKATYRNPGQTSYSGQYTFDSSDIETITIFYFYGYDYTGPSLEEYEQNTLLGDYTAKETFHITIDTGKRISGIIPWLKQWFYSKDEVYDTGWQPFPYKYQNRSATWCNQNGTIQTVTFGKSNSGDSDMLLFDYPGQPLRIRRVGKIVHIEGAMKSDLYFTDVSGTSGFPLIGLCCGEHNNSTYNGDFYFTVGTLDEKFRPSKQIITVQQASELNKYLVRIDPSGTVRIGRHGTTSYVNPQKNCWLNINVTYTVG